jgi:hypothetical protein
MMIQKNNYIILFFNINYFNFILKIMIINKILECCIHTSFTVLFIQI